jgi:hypothetical protein
MSKSSNSWQRQRYSWYTQMFSLENSDGWEGFAGSLAESHQAHKASWCMPCRSTLTMEEELEMRRFEIKEYRDRSKQINHACFCQSKMLLFHIVILCTIYVFLIMFNPSRQQCKQSRIFENDCCKQIFGLWEPVQPGSSRFKPVQPCPRNLEFEFASSSRFIMLIPGTVLQPRLSIKFLSSRMPVDACRWDFFNLKHGAERRWESGVFIDVYRL